MRPKKWRFCQKTVFGIKVAIRIFGPVNFCPDDQACFSDPGVILALLDDLCSMSGVQALGTKDEEIARARVGGTLTDRIGIQPVHR